MTEKWVILFLMIQVIKKFCQNRIGIYFRKIGDKQKKVSKSKWGERQIREMAKLGGKLVL